MSDVDHLAILSGDEGYCVSASRWPRKAEAALVLIEDEVGTPSDWRGILRIARNLVGPTMFRSHLPDIDPDCMCEDGGFCPRGNGEPVGWYWWFEGSIGSLEDAAWAHDPEVAS